MDGILDLDGFDANLAENLMFLTPFTANATDAVSYTHLTLPTTGDV